LLGSPPPVSVVAPALHLTDGDRWSVAAGLFGRSGQVSKRGVGDAIGVELEVGSIVPTEAFYDHLGGEHTPAGCAGLDASRLVDLVAECRDLRASAGRDLPNVEGRSPVQAEAENDLLGSKIAPSRHIGERATEGARGGDAGAGRGRLRACGLGRRAAYTGAQSAGTTRRFPLSVRLCGPRRLQRLVRESTKKTQSMPLRGGEGDVPGSSDGVYG